MPLNADMASFPVSKKFKGLFVFLLFGICPALLGAPISRSYDKKAKPYLRESRIDQFPKSILAFDIARGLDLAAVALSDLRVRIWRLSSGDVVHEFSFPEPATDQRLKLDVEVEPICLQFSPDGKTLAVSFLNVIHLLDVATWQERKSLAVEGEDRVRPGITVTDQTPQLRRRTARQAQAQSEQPNRDINQTMRGWAAERHLGDGRTRIRDFAFAPSGLFILASYCRGACWSGPTIQRVAVPTGNDPVRLWDLRSASIVWQRSYDPAGVISRLVFLPDSAHFIGIDSNLGHCAVSGCNLSDGRSLWSQKMGPCLYPPSIVVLQGEEFITNRVSESNLKNRKKKLWRYAARYSTADGGKIVDFPGRDGVGAAVVSGDGRWLVLSIWLGIQFQVWDLRENRVILKEVPRGWKRTAEGIIDIVDMTSDNHWLVVGSSASGRLAVYDFTLH